MTNLHDETEAARRLIEQIRADYPDDDDLLHDVVEGETDLLEICDWIARKIGEDDAAIAAITQYQDELGQRADRLAKRIESNRVRLAGTLTALDMTKMELPTATLSMRMGKQKVVVTNQDAIPDDYKAKRISFTIDKDTIRSRIDNGESIPGAHLSNAEPSLTIRRK